MARPIITWYTVEIKHHTTVFRGVILEALRPTEVVSRTIYEMRLREADVSGLIRLLQRLPEG
jgi:hypothetical protein